MWNRAPDTTPIPHVKKGDLTAARARLIELRAKEQEERAGWQQPRVGRPRKPIDPTFQCRFTIVFSTRLMGSIKKRAEYEDCSMTQLLRHAVREYLMAHKEHLDG